MSEILDHDFIGVTQLRNTSLNKLDFNRLNQQKFTFEKFLLEGFRQEKNERDISKDYRIDGFSTDSVSEIAVQAVESDSAERSASSENQYIAGLSTQYITDNQTSSRHMQRFSVSGAVANNHYVAQGTPLVNTEFKPITPKTADPNYKTANDNSHVNYQQEDIRFIRTGNGYSLYISTPSYENRLHSLKEIIRHFESKSGTVLHKVVVNREVVVQRSFSDSRPSQDEHYQVNHRV